MSRRAAAAALLARLTVDPDTITAAPADIDGFTSWTGRTPSGFEFTVLTPELRPGAPARARRRVRELAVASLSGRCPRCGAVAGHDPGALRMEHEPSCPLPGAVDRWARR